SAYFVPLVTICCLFSCSRDHPDLHSFPTRRSSDLQMESAFDAFSRHEERLRALSLRPSAYVRRQIRFTPYPTEDVGWVIAQAGRSEEHTSELQSRENLVCRLLLEKKKHKNTTSSCT